MLQAQTIEQAKVVVGISAHNEESTIAKTIVRLRGVADEVLLCDNGSSDSTSEIAEGLNCKVLSNANKLGPVEAIRALFLAALKTDADVLVIVPTRTDFDRSDISKLAESVLKKECDIAVGSRFKLELPKAESDLAGEVLTAAGIPVHDPRSPFRAYGKQALSKLVSYLRENDYDVLTYAMKLGLNVSEQQLSTVSDPSEVTEVSHPKKGKHQRAHAGKGIKGIIESLVGLRSPLFYAEMSIGAFAGGIVAAVITSYEYASNYAFSQGLYAPFGIEISSVLLVLAAIFSITSAFVDPIKKSSSAGP
jgi:glycosyltransferase involved in cell wall biosynthesis